MFYCRLKKKIAELKVDIKNMGEDPNDDLGQDTKEELKTRINYMDPRNTVAWCKRNEVPFEKVKSFLESNCQDGFSLMNKRNKAFFSLIISKKCFLF